MSKVLIVGGGAAGMMAGIAAAYNGNEVHLYEKNEKLGKKIFITGKGRCNITNASDIENHFKNIVRNSKFLYSAYNTFDSEAVMKLIEDAGVKVKIERGNRVFPESDKSSDVIYALSKTMKDAGVHIHLNTEITNVEKDGEKVKLFLKDKSVESGDKCIIATGGLSYKTTGSTGAGYDFAKHFGHRIEKTYPSLVPFNIKEMWCKELQGLSLKNVRVSVYNNEKLCYSDMGEMLFTHFGVSGPLILTASCYLTDNLNKESCKVVIDLKPALDVETLDKRLLKDFGENINKNLNNAFDKLLPKKLIPIVIQESGISCYKKVNEITKEERDKILHTIKNLTIHVSGLRDYNEAIITKGGISIKEINPKNMESKIVPGIYFAGEVLDLDALTGGYNLQIAWSTGYLAGSSICDW